MKLLDALIWVGIVGLSFVLGFGFGVENSLRTNKQIEYRIYQSLEHRRTIAEEAQAVNIQKILDSKCDEVVSQPGTYGSTVK